MDIISIKNEEIMPMVDMEVIAKRTGRIVLGKGGHYHFTTNCSHFKLNGDLIEVCMIGMSREYIFTAGDVLEVENPISGDERQIILKRYVRDIDDDN